MHTILPDGISTLFAEALDKSGPISGQPTEYHLAELRKLISQILLVIPYDEENGIHNLVSLIQYTTTHAADYTAAFQRPQNPATYNVSIEYKRRHRYK